MLESGAYRRRIEKRIRAGNTAPPSLVDMSFLQPVSTARRPVRTSLVPVLPVLAAVVALLCAAGCSAPAVASTQAPPVAVSHASTAPETPSAHPSRERPAAAPPQLPGRTDEARDVADGHLPEGATIADDDYPAVSRLDPHLRAALRAASTDAGIEFRLNSGWRSAAYQEQLLDEAVAKYGSRTAASRWVATPVTSPHVSGDAVDLAGSEATAWLAEHGARYGLCQVFRNEPWHFELRPGAVDRGCPHQYADPTHDPRMQR